MTQRYECGGTYIGVSECTRREEYDGIGGGSKWGVSIYDGVGSPLQTVRRRICNDQLPFISRKKWSPSFVDFVNKCLIRDMNERASVVELMQVSCYEMA